MQTFQAYAVYDSKAEAFSLPFFTPNRAVAIRRFSDEANQRDSELHRFSGDYSLFHLGSFDDSNGVFKPLKVPVSLGLAQEYINRDTSQSLLPLDN